MCGASQRPVGSYLNEKNLWSENMNTTWLWIGMFFVVLAAISAFKVPLVGLILLAPAAACFYEGASK